MAWPSGKCRQELGWQRADPALQAGARRGVPAAQGRTQEHRRKPAET